MPSSHSPDRLVVGFDDDHAVANAGLLLPATLAKRLGIEQTSLERMLLRFAAGQGPMLDALFAAVGATTSS